MLIIDSSNAVIAETDDPNYIPPVGYRAVPVPDDFYFETTNEWVWNGTALVRDPALILARKKADRLSELAAYRYEKETSGITLNGVAIETNRESQALINGAWSFSQLNPAVLIDWKGANGWIQIDAATIAAIAGAVATHVQACFSTERVHAEAIAALETSEAVQSYDITGGWPT